MDTQCAQILAHLKEGAAITSLEALRDFDCFRLGARVYDLRKKGHEIHTRKVKRGKKWVSLYWMEQADA